MITKTFFEERFFLMTPLLKALYSSYVELNWKFENIQRTHCLMQLRSHSRAIDLRLSLRSRSLKPFGFSFYAHFSLYLQLLFAVRTKALLTRIHALWEAIFFFVFVNRTITFSIRLNDFCFSIRPCRRQSYSLISITAHNNFSLGLLRCYLYILYS